MPVATRETWERIYPYSWLGILADVAPSTDELIYAWHPDGFALHSMRSATVSRLYLQVPPDADVAEWSDQRIWDAARRAPRPRPERLGAHPRPDHRQERAADAQLRPVADALRPPVPRRRRRPHRAADRRQGPQPRRRRRRAARAGARGPAARQRPGPGRPLLRHRTAPGLALHPLLLVDDDHAAHQRRPLRPPAPALPAPVGLLQRGGRHRPGRELRRASRSASEPGGPWGATRLPRDRPGIGRAAGPSLSNPRRHPPYLRRRW